MNNRKICSVFEGGAIVSEKELTELFQSLTEEGIDTIASNGERGFALTALTAADKAGLKIIAVMPFEGQADEWPTELKDKLLDLHKRAYMRFMISERYYSGCYAGADDFLLSLCGTVLIAGSRPGLQARAENTGKKVMSIHADDTVMIKPYNMKK